jgi:hypothetical protein
VSYLPARELDYQRSVAEYFLCLRGAGIMLSPLDLELLRAWELRGLPLPRAVVCRGLRHGLEAALRARPAGTPPPRSLRAYRLAVEAEWRAYREGRVGSAPGLPCEAAAAAERLRAAQALVEEGGDRPLDPRRAGHRLAREALAAAGPCPTLAAVDAALLAADEAVLRGWLRGLPRPARAALGVRCRLRAGPRLPWTRPAAYRAELRTHLDDAAREAGLLRLRGSV